VSPQSPQTCFSSSIRPQNKGCQRPARGGSPSVRSVRTGTPAWAFAPEPATPLGVPSDDHSSMQKQVLRLNIFVYFENLPARLLHISGVIIRASLKNEGEGGPAQQPAGSKPGVFFSQNPPLAIYLDSIQRREGLGILPAAFSSTE